MKTLFYYCSLFFVLLLFSCKTSEELMDKKFAKSGLKYDSTWRTWGFESPLKVKEEWRRKINTTPSEYSHKVTPELFDSANVLVAPVFRVDVKSLMKADMVLSPANYIFQCQDTIMYYITARYNNGQICKRATNGKWAIYNRFLDALFHSETIDSIYYKCKYPIFKVMVYKKGATYDYIAYIDKHGSMFYFDLEKSRNGISLNNLLQDTWVFYNRTSKPSQPNGANR